MYATKSTFKSCNYKVNQTISWRMLSDCQCEEIFVTAQELLERTGAEVASPKAREIFAAAGCWVDGNIVRFPSAKIEKALRALPKRLTLCGMDGSRTMMFETENVHFGLWGEAETIADRAAGEPRPLTYADIVESITLAEKLSNVEFVGAPGAPSDRPEKTAALYGLEAALLNSAKPVVFKACCAKNAKYAIDMAAAAAGGADRLRMNPRLVLAVECSEPRYHSEEALEAVMCAAENGVPFIYYNKLTAGQSAPSSIAAALVLALANTLVAAALAELVNEGAPVIAGCELSVYDEKRSTTPYGAPETSLLTAGFANLMRYLRIPILCAGGVSDSATLDSQYGTELAIGLLTASLAGANMVRGGGVIESGKQYSHTALAIADESMSLMYRIMKSFEVDEDRLARGVYDEVGPGGSYLGEPHTNIFFKSEQFWPNLFSRKRIKDWMEEGSKPMGTRASEYVETLLAQPARAIVNEETAKAVAAVIAEAEKEL